MPEGPSLVILKELVHHFEGKEIISVEGNSPADIERLEGRTILSFQTWGKHFLICVDGFTVKIHLLMFGTYRINDRKESEARMSLIFKSGEINFYTCSIKILEGDINSHYDWREDVMSESWNPTRANESLNAIPDTQICDALLDQNIFSGVGNIIKNEVLYRCKVHPESLIGKIPKKQISSIIKEARKYSFDFLRWKNNNELKENWLAYSQKVCCRCDLSFIKKDTGKKKRKSHFCSNCQKLYQ
ncbi:DNA-formamidopyrimidine glycosylase family protein [Flavobacterium sp. TAB 87]|uniref:DNA-formamidopyrimidine glycosylase family protein n=1 Tax=Flavobacterium sp. TAB 87 TaxID=1729581 RepID=UPI00076C58FE|nr:DNA-formamidopyrimidine glycosylase family protein [Flavobacterium sp. TAB 87]KVV15542.1 Formamidopyrimidine-DNA glycosylase [Flavobacterium sp. TAB 87]